MKMTLATLAALVGLAAFAAPTLAQPLQVGAYPANPPWEVKNERGEFEGFEVDLVRAIGEKLGREVVIQDLGFQALFAATSSGRIDMAISTITITPERLQSQSFTQGYYDSDMALATAEGSDIDSLEDMNGKIAGALATSTGEKWARENQERYGFSEIKTYNAQQDLLLDTRNGRVDGAISDIAGLQFTFMKMPGLEIAARIETGDQYGIMMPKDSPLLEEVNQAISELKEEGVLAELHEKWLGAPAGEGTSTVTVQPIPTATQ
ncbi:ABC transporter substrate-binding protein [Salinarimonas ramus]|uniref:Amino acid ABC transporter substrate-binding protein n=1 Tax=Salinarimonas ramus TaxID=690164 RepID=A0A917V2B8_9HYPH|nr:ABC transporter substrate-binding protein [Salinarimonas ramus]GGK21769.1 amino acid ABC transporter substrate-binding protein [Salinarimonas ramus]